MKVSLAWCQRQDSSRRYRRYCLEE